MAVHYRVLEVWVSGDGQQQRPKILVTGSFGFGNLGDEAILQGVLKLLGSLEPEPDVVVVAGNPRVVSQQHGGVQAIGWADWPQIIEEVANADLVLQGGGGLFFDYGEFRAERLLEPCAPDLHHFASFSILAWLLKTPFMILGCGVGPLHSAAAEDAVRACFEAATSATVRDPGSLAELERIGTALNHVAVSSDPSFLAHPAAQESIAPLLATAGIGDADLLIGVVVMPWEREMPEREWMPILSRGVMQVARDGGAKVCVIPFHPGYDDDVVEDFTRASSGVAQALPRTLLPAESMAVLSRCDLCVSMRLHGLILSAAAATPAVSIEYSPKVRNFANQLGLGEQCLGFDSLDRFEEVVRKAWDHRIDLSSRVQIQVNRLKEAAAQDREKLASVLTAARNGSVSVGSGRQLAILALEGMARRSLEFSLLEQKYGKATSNLSTTRDQLDRVLEELAEAQMALSASAEQKRSLQLDYLEVSNRLARLEGTFVVRCMRWYESVRDRLRG